MTTIEFFHDAVCGWCYLLSPRLRIIAAKYPVKIVHRAFVLQYNESDMITRFGSLRQAKQEILQHWAQCQQYAEQPELINIEGMRAASFDYPTGYLAALYAKAIEQHCGQMAHWHFFDAVQRAHLYEAQNIADPQVLNAITNTLACTYDIPYASIIASVHSSKVIKAVTNDNLRAEAFGIRTIPSLLINGRKSVSQTLSLEQLESLVISSLSANLVEDEL
ncbi:thioredoxin [Alteromonas sp. KUL42]|uniref:DsbA family oxidoreductase n=1 Tax=Alteromonas sp. KUL42 TaxID=2480797 RepID=UPI0010367422|nr:DsbA family protein [Alteromonas sp. KUL42]TAP33743.1 DsbA family protein [Alteromonas sp. KUL42]GEA08249.1 thioredoxin [Alteromonas sp. KUL42]